MTDQLTSNCEINHAFVLHQFIHIKASDFGTKGVLYNFFTLKNNTMSSSKRQYREIIESEIEETESATDDQVSNILFIISASKISM
jgi:hypothetical protein